jgi:hypothetical protein
MIADVTGYRFNLADARLVAPNGALQDFDLAKAGGKAGAKGDAERAARSVPEALKTGSFATVRVDGAVVAEIDNPGTVMLSGEMAKKLGETLPDGVDGRGGPELARARAEHIAEALGGEMDISAEALSQRQYDLLNDPTLLAAMAAHARGETLYQAQQAAQDAAHAAAEAAEAGAGTDESDAVRDFLEFMALTPEERMFEAVLREMGLTREELAALPPEERQKIEQEIREKIEKMLALQGGVTQGDDKKEAA